MNIIHGNEVFESHVVTCVLDMMTSPTYYKPHLFTNAVRKEIFLTYYVATID